MATMLSGRVAEIMAEKKKKPVSIDAASCYDMLLSLYPDSRLANRLKCLHECDDKANKQLQLQLKIEEDHIQKIVDSIKCLDEVIDLHSPEELSLSYNGGNDCCVLLVLLDAYSRYFLLPDHPAYDLLSKLVTIYFHHPNTFPEVVEYLEECKSKFNLKLRIFDNGFRHGLAELKETTNVKAIFMGTRRTDPYSSHLTSLAPTDEGWPQFLRVLPILDWDYPDVWSFLLDLNIAYCPLYDKGFTSIGYTHDTEPNPALKTEDGTFLPAWSLLNGSVERHGRVKKSLPSSNSSPHSS